MQEAAIGVSQDVAAPYLPRHAAAATSAIDKPLKRYIADQMRTVWGNLHPVDAACFAALMTDQTALGVTGSAVEIGVSQGRSLFLMAKALTPAERAYGIDLFDHDAHGNPGQGQLDAFKAHAARLGLSIPDDCIHVGPSEAVKADAILAAVGPARIFSVDGGHMLHHVLGDAHLAAATISADGIIVFDDFCNPEWPETTLGVLDFMREEGHGLVPFGITKDKLYVCRANYQTRYAASLRTSPWTKGYRKNDTALLGSTMAWVHHDFTDRVIYYALERFGLGRFAYHRQARKPL